MLEVGIVEWAHDYRKWNADQSAHIGQQFPVPKVRRDEYAAAGLVMYRFCLLKEVFEMFGLITCVPDDIGAVETKGRSYDFDCGEEECLAALTGKPLYLFFVHLVAESDPDILQGYFASSRYRRVEQVSQ